MKLLRRLVGAAAVTALTASGVLATTPLTARAYDPDVWDRVAACESSNRWDIDTGNGYYGGLQFSPTTWLEFGGGEYARYANDATKAEQIAVARRVLAVQGPGAWPVCSKRAGLTKSNGGADRDAQPGQGAADGTGGSEASGGGSATGERVVTVKPGDTLYALAQRYHVPGGYMAIARANNLPDPSMIRVGQRLRIPCSGSGCQSQSTPPPPPVEKDNDNDAPAGGRTITVKAGDTLYALAHRYDVSGGYMAIARANHLANPALIRVGQKLIIP